MELSQLYYEMLMSMVDQEQNYLDTLVSNLNANLLLMLVFKKIANWERDLECYSMEEQTNYEDMSRTINKRNEKAGGMATDEMESDDELYSDSLVSATGLTDSDDDEGLE